MIETKSQREDRLKADGVKLPVKRLQKPVKPSDTETQGTFDRKAYMRQYMKARRASGPAKTCPTCGHKLP